MENLVWSRISSPYLLLMNASLRIQISCLAIFAMIFSSFIPQVSAAGFSDVPADSPLAKAVEFLQTKGIKGYADGTFKPNNAVNRAEFLTMTLKVVGIDAGTAVEEAFSDVPRGEWYAPVISRSKKLGLAKGNPDGTFAPVKPVSLIDALVMLTRAYKIQPESCKSAAPAGIDGWVKPYFSCAVELKVLSASQQYKPDTRLSRGQTAQLQYLFSQGVSALKTAASSATNDKTIDPKVQKLLDSAIDLIAQSSQLTIDKKYDQAIKAAQGALNSSREAKKISQIPNVIAITKLSYAQLKFIETFQKNASGDRDGAVAAVQDAIATAKQIIVLPDVGDNLKKNAQSIIDNGNKLLGNETAVDTSAATVQSLLNATEQKMSASMTALLANNYPDSMSLIDEAVTSAKKAKEIAPDTGIVVGAAKIAYSLKQFVTAYGLAISGKYSEAVQVTKESIATAEQAKLIPDVDANIIRIADQIINDFGKKLLSDINAKLKSNS